jgi:hypothetical protein
MRLKQIFLSLIITMVVSLVVGIGLIKADFSGWIWSGNKEDITTNNIGFGWGEVSDSYGFDIPTEDGNVTGYVWSENIGWIDFDPSGTPPASPSHSVKREGNQLTGWARIVGIANESAVNNSGGWEGWIKMSGTTQSSAPYGVSLEYLGNGNDDALNDYAYSDEMGWITFEGIELPDSPALKICHDADDLNINIVSTEGDDSVDLGSYYKTSFLNFTCSTKSQSWITQVDSLSTWNSLDTDFDVNSEGVVSTTSDLNKGDITTITATYNGVSDSVEVCAYDCSNCFTNIGEDCDCGCGVSAEGINETGSWTEI